MTFKNAMNVCVCRPKVGVWRCAAFAVAFVISSTIFAAPVAEDDVRTAATKFVTADSVGSAIFSGRTVSGIRDADGLWVVSLAPAGHIIFSGSDLVDPVVGFSLTDFIDPNPESPAFAMLDGARKTSLAAETSSEGSRHVKWAKLLEARSRMSLLAGPVVPDPEPVIVPPFLQSHYSQWQPYNDYSPIYDSSATAVEGYFSYRGRCPCGCVSTGAALTFRHFRWPVRIDQNFQCDHSFSDTNDTTTPFPIRFDGHVPFDWSSFDDDYDYYNYSINGYDLRGSVAEAVRYPIARLVLWSDVMAQMWFGANGSSASEDSVVSIATPWYTRGTWVDVHSGAAQVRADMLAGVPCQISLGEFDAQGQRFGGHLVVAHGWAEDASSQYVYLNFGWGGNNDGYYNVADDFQSYQEKKAYVGCYPRAKPQIEPLPKVCETNVTLNWHFPGFYTNCLSGFTIAVSKPATTPTTFRDDFSASAGVSTSDALYVGVDGTYGYDGNLLYAASNTVGTYTFNGSRTLTSASVLTFKVFDYCANSLTYEIQASFDGGDWQTIYEPVLTHFLVQKSDGGWYYPSSQPSWRAARLFLGDHGGQTARFRIVKGYNLGGTYFSNGRILLDDFQVTDVLEQEAPTLYGVAASERNLILPRLDNGVAYTFTVTPQISSALVEGESSDPVSVVIAGNQRVPIPGEQIYHLETLSFSTSDSSGVWSYLGNPVFVDGVSDDWCDDAAAYNINGEIRSGPACKIIASLTASETLTEDSIAYFAWRCSGYQHPASEYNIITTTFIDENGIATEVERLETYEQTTAPRYNSVPLGRFAGHSGRIEIKLVHRPVFTTYVPGQCVIEGAQLLNVRVPSTPSVQWGNDTATDFGTPVIVSVSNVVNGVAVSPIREGFFRECKYGETTVFDVACSDHVENLNAYSSHLALVGDRQVTTQVIGPHTFRVFVDASNIGADQSRSRLILTLEAIDANGTKTYKDLSLRFSDEGEPLEVLTDALPVATVGELYAATLTAVGGDSPYTWSAATSAGYDDSRAAGSFREVGTIECENNDEDSLFLELPFEFPFYGSTYRSVYVNPNGVLTFNGALTGYNSYNPSINTFQSTAMIAPLWSDYDLVSISVDNSSAEAVTICWSGIYWNTPGRTVSFSATLNADGTILFRYGEGNSWGGIIGVSSGNGIDFIEASESRLYAMANANDIVFTLWRPLPLGFSLSSSGVLSGTPTTAGISSFTAFVTDGAGTRVGKTFNLTMEQPVEPLAITTSVLPPATSGVPYRFELEATGGVAPYEWFAPVTMLPPGFSLSSDGTLSGTPTASGVTNMTVFVTDDAGTRAGRTFNLTIEQPPAPPAVSPSENSVIVCESNVGAENLANLINLDKPTCIKAPETVGLSGSAAVAYANLFDAHASGNNVVIELNTVGTNALETAATNVVAQVAADLSAVAATAGATAIAVTGAQPGFYYSVVYDNNLRTLGSTAAVEGARALANADGSVRLPIPAKKPNAAAGFYRVKVSVKAED